MHLFEYLLKSTLKYKDTNDRYIHKIYVLIIKLIF